MSQQNFVSYDDATSIVTEVASKIAEKQDVLSFDNSPTQNSDNPVKSGGVYTALASKANTSDIGTAAAKNFTTSVTSGSNDLVTSGAVYTAIENLPEPMVFKGSLGTGGTITALPVDGTATKGDTYKVITDGTYASKPAKVGDTFVCLTKTSSANTWELIPSGDEPSGTVTSVTLKATSPIAIDSSSAITTSGTRTLSHANSGATAGSYGDSGNQTPGYGSTFKVPYVTVNATGHVTAISEHTVKIPASDNTNTTYTFAGGTNGFTVTPSGGSAQTVTVTPSFTVTTGDSNGQVKVNGTNASVKGLGSAAYTSNDNILYKNVDIPEGAANLNTTATAHKITTYRNGFTIPYQMDNANDGGLIRCRGTSESSCIFEMATWDDSGAGETIQFNYYPTTSQITPTYSVEVPKKSGTIALTSDVTNHTNPIFYGTCSTAASTAAKVATCSKFSGLAEGVTVKIKFSNNNTADNPTLNVNSTGAKAIWKSGGNVKYSNPGWMANEVISFTYDGTRWIMNDVLSSGRLHTQGYNNRCDTSMMTCSVAGRSASLGGLLDVRQASQDIFTIGATGAYVIDTPAQGILINQSTKTIYPIIGIDNVFSSISGSIPVGQYIVLCNFRVIYTYNDFA